MDNIKQTFKGKRVLITGGGGYLGSSLAEKIVKYAGAILLADTKFNKLSTGLAKACNTLNIVEADLLKTSELAVLCKAFQPDFIYHFAASLDRSRDFSIYPVIHEVNVTGTLNLLEALSQVADATLFYSGSAEVYGNKNKLPFTEDMLPDPASPYSLTKYFAEKLIQTYSAVYNNKYIIFRLFNFYGPGMPDNTFIPQLLKARDEKGIFVMSKGEQKRDYLPTDDLLYYMMALTGTKEAIGEIVNICSGASVSMSEIADFTWKKSGKAFEISKTMPYRDNEIWDIRGSVKKLKSLVPGYKPGSIFDSI